MAAVQGIPNGDALRKCILKGPYTPTIVTTPDVPATEDSPPVPEQITVETVMNMTPENRAHFESEKEAIHLILTDLEAIKRLQQGESLNIQDVNTNLFWEFGQFTSHDGETIESYYTRFYKMMNEMIRNNLTVATMQVNVQFLQQLQPEWSRFVTIVKQQHKLMQITPPSESASEEDSDPEQAQKDKDMQKNLALIDKDFKKLLQTYQQQPQNFLKHQKQECGYYSKEFGHYAKECRKPKRVKDSTYHKEKMLLCKQAEKGVQLQAEQSDWLETMTQAQTEPLEQDDQNDVECDDERVALANLIANLKLDVDENKKIQKQLKKANATLTQELTECKSILAETSRTLGESNSIRDSCLVALQNKQTEFERYKAFNDRTVDYVQS
ncbi:hypothetical protein Tco_0079108 [Tanacetum coccineum]